MKKSLLLIILFCTIFYLFFSSCKKIVENKIDGIWRRSNMANPNSNEYEEWHIENSSFYVVMVKNDGSQTQISQGEYKITDKIYNLKRIFSVTKSTDNSLIDEWRIKELTKEYLTLRSSNGSILLEFTKQ